MNSIHMDIIKSFREIPTVESIQVSPATQDLVVYIGVLNEDDLENTNLLVQHKTKALRKRYPNIILYPRCLVKGKK